MNLPIEVHSRPLELTYHCLKGHDAIYTVWVVPDTRPRSYCSLCIAAIPPAEWVRFFRHNGIPEAAMVEFVEDEQGMIKNRAGRQGILRVAAWQLVGR